MYEGRAEITGIARMAASNTKNPAVGDRFTIRYKEDIESKAKLSRSRTNISIS